MPARKGADLGRWVRDRREEIGLSLSQVQVRTQGAVGASYLSRIEREGRVPGPEVLLALAPVLRVEAEFLYKLAGYLPAQTKVAEPAAVYRSVDTMEAIKRAIRENPDLDDKTKNGLELSAELLVAPHLEEARRRKRRRISA